MSESAGEKSFAPSAKRKRDAAQKGDVLRSRELATAGAMLVGAAWRRARSVRIRHSSMAAA